MAEVADFQEAVERLGLKPKRSFGYKRPTLDLEDEIDWRRYGKENAVATIKELRPQQRKDIHYAYSTTKGRDKLERRMAELQRILGEGYDFEIKKRARGLYLVLQVERETNVVHIKDYVGEREIDKNRLLTAGVSQEAVVENIKDYRRAR